MNLPLRIQDKNIMYTIFICASIIIYSILYTVIAPLGFCKDFKRVIVDVDVGYDDYLGLLILLQEDFSGNLKIEAIGCTNGLSEVENTCKNVIRLLEKTNRTDIPVYKGSTFPLIKPAKIPTRWDGIDGFGDLSYDQDPDMSLIQNEKSPIGFSQIILNNPKEISLLATAPLTNIALASRLQDDTLNLLKEIWIMGGNYNGTGSLNFEEDLTCEYNFAVDIEAAQMVINGTEVPTYLFSWEKCLDPQIKKEELFELLGGRTPSIRLFEKAMNHIPNSDPIFYGCDAFVAFAFIRRESITEQSSHMSKIILDNLEKRGQILIDQPEAKTDITYIENINLDSFKNYLLSINV